MNKKLPKGKREVELEKKVEELENKLKKALADYQNLKKDMDKRLDFESNLLRADLLRSVVDIADDIDVAIDHVKDEKGWREGVTMILEKFRSSIEGMGAEMIECKPGDQFNAELHEAIGVVYEGDPGTIAKVIQNGYRIGETIIRPSRVMVNKGQKVTS